MSLPDSSSDAPRGVLVRRQRNSVYTVLLLVALLALVIASLLMLVELWSYDFQFRPPANLRASSCADSTNLLIV